MSQSSSSSVVLPDGASLAYSVLGAQHTSELPIVLVGGLSSTQGDWQKLSERLAKDRPVLVFDHRGIGLSKFAGEIDELTIESMARDLLYLIESLRWKTLAICGFSMGGVVVQQLLFLPYHPTNPTPLPRITHVFLAATMTSILRDRKYGLRFPKPTKALKTVEERRTFSRPVAEQLFDPKWLEDPANRERLTWWLDRMTIGRPYKTIAAQARACMGFNFAGLYEKVPSDTRIMVIHGEIDTVLPFSGQNELLQRFPRATAVQVGTAPGQLPNLAFGHQWFEYFDIEVWRDVITKFIEEHPAKARL